jgi:uncharacterized repeat protein (TIGR03837 family)
MNFTSLDIFCHVIDNFGDAGVVYRFAREVKKSRPLCRVRVFIDDLALLQEILAEIDPNLPTQELESIEYIDTTRLDDILLVHLGTADVLMEAFGCDIPAIVLDAANRRGAIIINLEYLSAEAWVADYHLKESLTGRAGLRKYFYMPGFTSDTGGVIIDTDVEHQINRDTFRQFVPAIADDALIGTVFTYQRGFDTLLADLLSLDREVVLLVFGAKSHSGMIQSLQRISANQSAPAHWDLANIHITMMPMVSQSHYDRLLAAADFNLVRGEDSLVRAILAGKPFLWQAYIQAERYQLVKVRALMTAMAQYFDDADVFSHYQDLSLPYNDLASEGVTQSTDESYRLFFGNLKKIEHSIVKMRYFIVCNCNLVAKFTDFIDRLQNRTYSN